MNLPNFFVKDDQLVFECGCTFKITGEQKANSLIPPIKFNPDIRDKDHDINFACPHTYELLSKGLTKGVFQLETPLGRQWSKKLKPDNMEHIAALSSILRPGALESILDDGVNMTGHFCKRKNNEEEAVPFHDAIADILSPSYQIIIYQESILKIAQKVAGFDLKEADTLRKACGKKLASEMTKVKKLFLEKGKQVGLLTDEQLEQLFEWIEKSQRYIFNKSHAVGYGVTCYITAFIKTHFPLAFYRKWLEFAKEKQDPMEEISGLVNDAKTFDIEVMPPDITFMSKNFHTDGKTIYFGLTDIKGVGDSQFKKLQERVNELEFDWESGWFEFLICFGEHISSSVMERLILTGALRRFGIDDRIKMLYEYHKWQELSKGEKKWMFLNRYKFTNLNDAFRAACGVLKCGGACHSKVRVDVLKSMSQLLDNPPQANNDTIDLRIFHEQEYLGIALTRNNLEKYNAAVANCTCQDLMKGKQGYSVVGVEILRVNEVKTKKGKNPGQPMGFLSIMDESGELDSVVVFPQIWQQYKHLIQPGNFVLLRGKMSEQESFQVDVVYQMERS